MEPKITFGHTGDYYVAYQYLLRKLGYTVIVPPKSTKESLDLGIKYSSGQACFPFKVLLGNFIQGLDKGANFVVMIGGRTGICRLAYYTELYKKILNNMGYEFEFFPFKLKKEMWDIIKKHFPNTKFIDFVRYFYAFWHKFRLLEILREQTFLNRPYEIKYGACTQLYNRLLKQIDLADSVKEMKELKKQIFYEFENVPKDKKKQVIKIGIVGEFFILIDQFSSLNIEHILGDLGVVVIPSAYLSGFMLGSLKQVRFLDMFLPTKKHKIAKLAKPFINRRIGGHTMESIGHTIEFALSGIDGVIHIYPFTCMPEITATAIFPKVSKKYDIPVLSLCFDEQTGIAGIQTRLEAFVDMIKRKKFKKGV